MRKKLQLYTLAFCLVFLSFLNTAKATGPFYYKGTGALNLTTSWTTNASGSGGTAPSAANLTANGITWNLFNSVSAVTATLSTSFPATGSTLVVGSAKTATLTISGSGKVAGILNIGNNSTVISTIATAPFNTAGSFATSSTFIFSNNSSTVPTAGATQYGNLTLSGTKATLQGYVSVAGTFQANAIVLSGNELDLNGTISSMGTITGDANSSISITNGPNLTLTMDQTTVGTTNVLLGLSYDDGGAGNTLTLANALNIAPGGVITPISGTIAGGGNLTLVADQVTVGNTGSIGAVGGSFTGNITSQIYYDPTGFKTNWSLLGSSGISNATFASWMNSFYVTCPSGCNSDGSAQNSGTPFTSITTFDETTDTYPGISSAGSAINPGTGYWVYLGTASPGTTSSPILITLTGTPVTGNVGPISLTNSGSGADNGYNLVANPYPSPIFWSSVYSDNSSSDIGGTISLYSNANQSYAYMNQDGTYTNDGSYDVSSGLIPTGEGFYIFANSNTTLTFSEDQKGQGPQALGRYSSSSSHNVQSTGSTPFFQIDVAKDTIMSEAAISFNPNATLGQDSHDGVARPWNKILQISTASLGVDYAINGLPGFSQNYSLPVKILSKTTAQYTISAKNLQKIPVGPCLILHDNYGIMPDQDLRGGAFTVTINDSETVARFVLNITTTPLVITTNAVNASCHVTNDGLITAVGNDAGPWNYIWKNASGTIVKTSLNKATADTLNGVNNGVFSVNVSTVGTCNSATQTFTLVAPASPVAAFTALNQVNLGDNVAFTNNSTNATNYIWNFGDGGVSSMQTPNYIYNNAGTYIVTLQAINANCNDTVSSTQVITVNATTGIKQANTGTGDINISRDASGNYIQFDYTNQTKVNITVYNVLGQTVLNNSSLNVVNDKIYINILDNKNQVLYVSITDLATNKQTIKKFVND